MELKLYKGNCLEHMREKIEDCSVDTILTDPPYGLEFMGKEWDRGVPGVIFWKEMFRIAKPGAVLMAMGGTRTYHRLATAIEDAGWEIFDMIAWVYGQGFPKNYNISKGMDKARGETGEVIGQEEVDIGIQSGNMHAGRKSETVTRDVHAPASPDSLLWEGWGTRLKPAFEPICLAMKPIDGTYVENALKWGVAGLNIDGARVPTNDEVTINTFDDGSKPFGGGAGHDYTSRKESEGRYPANFIHDGSKEVVDLFPTSKSSVGRNVERQARGEDGVWNNENNGLQNGSTDFEGYDDEGSAARFFYCAKASKAEKDEGLNLLRARRKAGAHFRPNHMEKAQEGDTGNAYGRWDKIKNYHPTVKPIALMEYLVRLSKTPTGGVVYDPFMGSGTTGIGCILNDRDFIGSEQDEGYFEIADIRLDYWKHKPRQRKLF